MGKKIAVISKECVACGSCVKSCKLNAISIYKGMYAVVNPDKCIGCGMCKCVANVISITERMKQEDILHA